MPGGASGGAADEAASGAEDDAAGADDATTSGAEDDAAGVDDATGASWVGVGGAGLCDDVEHPAIAAAAKATVDQAEERCMGRRTLPERTHDGASGRWYARPVIRSPTALIALLTGLNLLNYLDRYLFAAVSPSIQKELSLSDTQVGLAATAFLWGYMLTSPIFGRLGDVMPRKWLIALGVLVWCGATAASGLCKDFTHLMIARGAVGVGEAAYAALAPTMLDDVTVPERRGRVLAVFYSAISVGSAMGFMLGGALDQRYGWRAAFFLAGGPGMLLVLSMAAVVEPARRVAEGADAVVRLGDALSGLWGSGRYVLTVVGFTAQTAVLGCFSNWAPHFLERRYAMDKAAGNFWFGAILVVTGFVGTFLGGSLTDRSKDQDRNRGALAVCAWSALLATPLVGASLLMPSPVPFFAVAALAQVAIFVSMSPMNGVLMGSVPAATRGLAMSASILVGHVLGDVPFIPLVGWISDKTGSLPNAMLLLPLLMAVCAAAWFGGIKAREARAAAG